MQVGIAATIGAMLVPPAVAGVAEYAMTGGVSGWIPLMSGLLGGLLWVAAVGAYWLRQELRDLKDEVVKLNERMSARSNEIAALEERIDRTETDWFNFKNRRGEFANVPRWPDLGT